MKRLTFASILSLAMVGAIAQPLSPAVSAVGQSRNLNPQLPSEMTAPLPLTPQINEVAQPAGLNASGVLGTSEQLPLIGQPVQRFATLADAAASGVNPLADAKPRITPAQETAASVPSSSVKSNSVNPVVQLLFLIVAGGLATVGYARFYRKK